VTAPHVTASHPTLTVGTGWWDIIVDFLDGRLDHADPGTRRDVATALYRVDHAAYLARGRTGTLRQVSDWDAVLCRVTTEDPGTLL
jgi:hypothetical protein